MSAPQTILTLVETFEHNPGAYRSGKDNKTQIRRAHSPNAPHIPACSGNMPNKDNGKSSPKTKIF